MEGREPGVLRDGVLPEELELGVSSKMSVEAAGDVSYLLEKPGGFGGRDALAANAAANSADASDEEVDFDLELRVFLPLVL